MGLLVPLASAACDDGASADRDAGSDLADTEPFDAGPWPDEDGWDLGDLGVDSVEPDACDALAELRLVRARSVPGGRQLHVVLLDGAGAPLDASFAGCLALEADGLGPLPLAFTADVPEPAATLIVVRDDRATNAAAVASALVALRPDGERIAVWRWADQLTQLATATRDRSALLDALDALDAIAESSPAEASRVVAPAIAEWSEYDDKALLAFRNVVFVAPGASAVSAPSDSALALWAADSLNGEPGVVSQDDAQAVAEALNTALDRRDATGLTRLGFCDPGTDLVARFRVGDRVVAELDLGDAAVEHIARGCSSPDALAERPDDLPVVEIVFSPSERQTYDARHAANDATPFTGSLRTEPDGALAPIEANFRGQSSLACARKNFSINLDGSDPRHVIHGTGSDEFYLISMCLDDRYVNQTNADALLERFGMWRLAFGLVELRIDGVSAGVYLYVEDVGEEPAREFSRARAVVRRRTDIDNKPAEVKWSYDDDDGAALARYDAFVAQVQALSGSELEEYLESTFDLDLYLRWMALMSILRNGDYIDEVHFVAVEGTRPDGSVGDFYTLQTWDPDDIFSDCHHTGRFAVVDPNELLYCAEGLIDHAMFDEPGLYRRYVEALEQMLAELTPEIFEATTSATLASLTRIFEGADVRAAMVELLSANPAATDRDVAVGELSSATQTLVADYTARRTFLLDKVAAWRQANP